jgi:hypothetical protein
MFKYLLFKTRLLLVSGFFFSFLKPVFNQKFEAGLLAGLNTSQITGDNFSGYNQPGIIGGLWISRQINEKMKLVMEMEYLPKGSRRNPKPNELDFAFYRLRLHYIEVPIVFNYKAHKRFTLETGLSFGALVGVYEADENGPLTGNFAPVEQFKRSDISFNAGINWLIDDKWTFNVRSINSIFPVRDFQNQVTTFLNRGQYSNCVMGRFLYQF